MYFAGKLVYLIVLASNQLAVKRFSGVLIHIGVGLASSRTVFSFSDSSDNPYLGISLSILHGKT